MGAFVDWSIAGASAGQACKQEIEYLRSEYFQRITDNLPITIYSSITDGTISKQRGDRPNKTIILTRIRLSSEQCWLDVKLLIIQLIGVD